MDNINYIDMPVSEFTAALASSSPAPGGGGASALAAALGASLGCMVGELTVGKPKYAANEPRLRELIAEAQSLRERLLTLVDADAEAFLPLAEAYRLPKDAPDRGAVMEKCLADAAAVPMEILELSCRVIALQEEFAALGSSLAVSDAGTGAVFAWAAMYGAALNVLANTRLMADRERAEDMNCSVNELMQEYRVRADRVYGDIFAKLSDK